MMIPSKVTGRNEELLSRKYKCIYGSYQDVEIRASHFRRIPVGNVILPDPKRKSLWSHVSRRICQE